MRALLLGLALAGSGVAQAGGAVCYHPAFSEDVTSRLEVAEAEYPKWDAGRFLEIAGEIAEAVGCLEDPVTPEIAARIHRVLALRSRVVDKGTARARVAFAAARALEPKYRFPETMIRPGEPELDDYEAVPLGFVVTEPAPAPTVGEVRFDGRATLERPANLPTIYQRVGADGKIVESAYLWPGDALPIYPSDGAAPVTTRGSGPRKGSLLLGAASLGLGGAGVTLLTTGLWDVDHTCLGEADDSACKVSSRERILAGGVLTGVGVVGLGGTVLLLDGGAGLHISGRW